MSWQGTWNGALCRRKAGIRGPHAGRSQPEQPGGLLSGLERGYVRPELQDPGLSGQPIWPRRQPRSCPRVSGGPWLGSWTRDLLLASSDPALHPSVLYNPPPAEKSACQPRLPTLMDLIISVTESGVSLLVSSLRVEQDPGAESPDSLLCSSSFPQRRGGAVRKERLGHPPRKESESSLGLPSFTPPASLSKLS